MANEQDLVDLAGFLNSPRADLRRVGVHAVLGLTGSQDGRNQLMQTDDVVRGLVRVVGDLRSIARDALGALVNLSADGDVMTVRQMLISGLVEATMSALEDPQCRTRRLCCMLLANLTKHEAGCLRLLQTEAADGMLQGLYLRKLVHWFVHVPVVEPEAPEREVEEGEEEAQEQEPAEGAGAWAHDDFQHVANILVNVTQVQEGRVLLRDRQLGMMPKISPMLQHENPGRRAGVAACIRNCAFEEFDHWWMLRDTSLLTNILLPLVGPEGFRPDDIVGMDEALHTQGAEKRREPDADIRRLLIETLIVFCLTREGREILREKKVYPVVRDMHLAENNESVEDQIFKLVDFLINDEEGDAPDFDELRAAAGEGFASSGDAETVEVSASAPVPTEADDEGLDPPDLPPLE